MVGLVGQEGEAQYGRQWREGKADKRGFRSVGQNWGAPLPEAVQGLADRGVERRIDGADAPFLSDRGARQKSFNSSATTARR